uniref:CG4682-like protein n=1 Tax=Drosophila buzzatii TaxID=7264 RepID=I3RSD4_DROBU|nr:CG4682-like protein [Drosophila buzzatii]
MTKEIFGNTNNRQERIQCSISLRVALNHIRADDEVHIAMCMCVGQKSETVYPTVFDNAHASRGCASASECVASLWHTAAARLQETKYPSRLRNVYGGWIGESNYSYADYRAADQVDAGNNQLRVVEVLTDAQGPAVQVKVTNEVESAVMRAKAAAERLQLNGNEQSKASHAGVQIVRTSNQDLSSTNLMIPAVLPISERHNFANNNNNNNSSRGSNDKNSIGPMAGDEQLLRLQDYNLLYNAERQTYFQLHSSSGRGPSGPSNGNRLLHQVVGNKLSAAFGLNVNANDGNQKAIQMTTQTVRLYDAASLRQSHFNPFQPTRIIIHGWLGNAHANVYSYLVPAYLNISDSSYNIFTVDWGRGAIADYITASYRVKPVGQVLAKFLDFLHVEAGMQFEDLQLIGFSMGAHIAGLASKHVQTGHVRVIRALDPALPFFRYAQETERLSRNDASYVEVLHTSVGSYGFDRPLGHADFYANWGSQQPGCFWHECSHWRAFALFKESLESVAFEAKGCQPSEWQQLIRHKRCPQPTGSSLHMGGDLSELSMEQLAQREGVYYFETHAKPPYDMGPAT